jgi:SAM-dependent methyltransferase
MNGDRCPLCGSGRVHAAFGGTLRCASCDHCFAVGLNNAAETAGLYDEGYFSGRVYRDYFGEADQRTAEFAAKLRLLDGLVPTTGAVLDVGCAAGYFAALMHRRGYRVRGVEISTYAADFARRTHGIEVFAGELAAAEFASEQFDLVSFWDSLEHFVDPTPALREARRVLKDSGVLLIETLNYRSASRAILGTRWPLFAPPYHIHYFSRRSLGLLLEREGFRVCRVVPIQTYFRGGRSVRPWRYYRRSFLRGVLGSVAADVILYAAVKAEN